MLRGFRNYQQTERDVEWNDGTTQTIEDDTYSIRELVERFTKGQYPLVQKQGIYDEDPDHDSEDLSALTRKDIFEQQQYIGDTFSKQKEILEQQKQKSQSKKYKTQEDGPPLGEPEQLEDLQKEGRPKPGEAKRKPGAGQHDEKESG